MVTLVADFEGTSMVEELTPSELPEEIKHWTTVLDVMAAITTDKGSVLFGNELFRTFVGSSCGDLSIIEPFCVFFSSDLPANIPVHICTVQQRTLLAAKIPFLMPAGQKALLFLILDVDSKILEGDEFSAMKERMELLEVILGAS